MKINKLQFHYFLLFVGIILILLGAYFVRYDEIHITEIMLGIYLIFYVALYIRSYKSFKSKGLDFEKISKKKIYSTKLLIKNILLFMAILLFSAIVSAYLEKFLGKYFYYIYYTFLYICFAYFLIIPGCKFVFQEKYPARRARVISVVVLVFFYLAIKAYLEFDLGWQF